MDEQEFHAKLIGFLRETEPAGAGATPGPDDNLFNLGLLESFSIPRVIQFLEELSGRPLALERAGIDAFLTSRSIYAAFIAPGTAVRSA